MNRLASEILAMVPDERQAHHERQLAAHAAAFFLTQDMHKTHASFWLGAVKLRVDQIGADRGTLFDAMEILTAAADLAAHYASEIAA